MRKLFQRAVRTFGVTAAVTLGFVAGGPAVAASAKPAVMEAGVLSLCSEGGYGSYLTFPKWGGVNSVIVPNGSCRNLSWPGSVDVDVDVYMADGQYIGSTIYNGSVGLNIFTHAGPTFVTTITP
jgi:hypothetical protein